ncbi:MAG: dTDP-4-dehydrorhamnose reductase [Candidatus Zixiibacteriota bacterium]
MIWLIGSNGMLGKELAKILAEKGIVFRGTDREVDIRDLGILRRYASGEKIQWIINCSAYTAVDKAEEEEDLAHSINATGAGNIAQVANEIGAVMIHISTDYVFKGDATFPYLESDLVNPQGVYGRTKAEGEYLVINKCPRSFILRTSWLYGKYGQNFVTTMLRLMKERTDITVVADQIGTPTWTFDLATVIISIIEQKYINYGIYHYSNRGETTWFEFACEIQRQAKYLGLLTHDCHITPISSEQYFSKVKRPAWSVLSKEKIIKNFRINPPEWKMSLSFFLNELLLNEFNIKSISSNK